MADLVSHPDEVKVVSRRFGLGATDIDRYLELDGYKAVQKALAMEPDAIVNEVKNSGLRGRGGAGFSTGMKWSFVPKQSAKPKYVLCNGDESEPGTCKDRLIFEHDPHSVIEGVMIGALAVGAKSGYIYIRGEYRYLSNIMQKAIRDAYAKGFAGKNIFGSGRDLDIYWHGGAGAYEVGEESALMESLEGKRGIPRIRPPFPAVVGLWGGPTVINNAETLANVPHIILGGADWYAKLGTPKNGGTRLFCLSGNIARPGVYELPMGYNLKKMIYDVGGECGLAVQLRRLPHRADLHAPARGRFLRHRHEPTQAAGDRRSAGAGGLAFRGRNPGSLAHPSGDGRHRARHQGRRLAMRFNPAPDEVIHSGDHLIVMGEPAGLRRLEDSATERA